MKKLLLIAAIVTGLVAAVFIAERWFLARTIGPAAVASLAVLVAFFVTSLTLYLLHDTHRELVTNICVAIGSTLVTYFIIDVIAGILLIQRLSPPFAADQYRHHILVPNSLSSFQQQDFRYVQRVNNLGMRGDDVAITKPAGSYRILMLGDSFTMGKGVEDQQTFSMLLQSALRQHVAACGGHRSIDVLNGGVDSYAPILSYVQLKRDLGALNPDMVILNLDVSDLVQETAYRQIAVYDDRGDIVGVPQTERPSSIAERVRAWMERHLFITRAVIFYLLERANYREFTVRGVVEQANLAVAAHTLEEDTESRTEQWANIFDTLGRIQQYADARGIAFLLTEYPWGHQVSDKEWQPGRYTFMRKGTHPSDRSRITVHELSNARHIELVDLFPAFRAYHGDKMLYFQHDLHWTATGHQVAAAALDEYLTQTRLASWCR